MADETRARVPRMDWIDYLRMLCALVVLIDHLALVGLDPRVSNGITGYGLITEIGRFGNVALFIFFLISGMMITLIAQTMPAATFVAHRAARIYPLFVLCLTITTLFSPWGPIGRFHVSGAQYAANLTLNPMALGYRWVDASYWTLLVEVTFYAAMTAVTLLGWQKHLQTIIALWVMVQVLTCPFFPTLPLIGYHYYFIAAGAVLALLYQRRNERLNYVLLALALVPCIRCVFVLGGRTHFDPWIGTGVILSILALFLFMRGRQVRLPWAQRIGSLAYPLYLLHFHIGLTLLAWWGNETNKWLILPAVTLLLIAVSALLDDVVEFRMRAWWRRFFGATIARPIAWLEARGAKRRAAG